MSCIIGLIAYNFWNSPIEEVVQVLNLEESGKEDKSSRLYVDSMDEKIFQHTLHNMTHQKVYAESKKGSMQITNEKIEELLSQVEASDFDHKGYYTIILTDWKNGDFSNAVEVHNLIWSIQGGTIGKAERLLTEEEEKAYIEINFK